jgi:hypothetical protein
MVGAAVHPADAPLVVEAIHDLFPWLRHLFADSAYSGDKLLKALAKFGRWSIEIVKRGILVPMAPMLQTLTLIFCLLFLEHCI